MCVSYLFNVRRAQQFPQWSVHHHLSLTSVVCLKRQDSIAWHPRRHARHTRGHERMFFSFSILESLPDFDVEYHMFIEFFFSIFQRVHENDALSQQRMDISCSRSHCSSFHRLAYGCVPFLLIPPLSPHEFRPSSLLLLLLLLFLLFV